MFKITSKWDHADYIKIEWNIGKRCNLDCSYCPAYIHDNTSQHTNIELLKLAVNNIKKIKKPCRISLTGGEPCVHPKIEELIDYIYTNNISWLNITTNGTRTAKWYASLPVSHYVFSLHFDNKLYKKITQNIIEFSNINLKNIPFHVHIMAHHEYINEMKDTISLFDENKIKYTIRRIRWTTEHDNFNDSKYQKDDLEFILSKTSTVQPNCIIDNTKEYHANDILKEKLNNFLGWECNIGLESLMINWDGEVHRATCRVGGSIGNIYKNNVVIPTNSITCTRQWCTCAADIPITKVAPL